jgi:two-component system nitrogen regulation response regulator GlnG
MDGTVLVADDDRTIRTVLTQALTRAGCKVHATASLTTLMRWIDEGLGDLVITDIVMPDGDGLALLPEMIKRRPGLPVIVISAQNTIMTAVRAEAAEAYDYLPKPFDLPDLMHKTAVALNQVRDTTPTKLAPSKGEQLPLVGGSPKMQALYKLIAKVVNLPAPVLITGESGVGKTLVAKTIHDFSDRRNATFISVSARDLRDATDPDRFCSRAIGGTLLFENIDRFSSTQQSEIARAIDLVEDASVRFLATSQRASDDLGDPDVLKPDLLFRLNSLNLLIPTLRSRTVDIPSLCKAIVAKVAQPQSSDLTFSADAITELQRYAWPGNVRQLENVVQQLAVLSEFGSVTASAVRETLNNQPGLAAELETSSKLSSSVGAHIQQYFDRHGDLMPPPGLYNRILREIETPLISIALNVCNGNQLKCAELLGINRNTLRKKINDNDIHVTRRRTLM